MSDNKDHQCICYEPVIKVSELARAYVPIQHMCNLYNENISLVRGTIFPELDKPYNENREV